MYTCNPFSAQMPVHLWTYRTRKSHPINPGPVSTACISHWSKLQFSIYSSEINSNFSHLISIKSISRLLAKCFLICYFFQNLNKLLERFISKVRIVDLWFSFQNRGWAVQAWQLHDKPDKLIINTSIPPLAAHSRWKAPRDAMHSVFRLIRIWYHHAVMIFFIILLVQF